MANANPWTLEPHTLPSRTLLPVLFFLALATCPVSAQQTTNQFWPEIDVFANLNSNLRASWMSTHATDKDSNTTTWEFGPNLDIYLKSIRGRLSHSPDASKHKYVVMRLGYHILPSSKGVTEQRGIIEVTARFYLPKSFLLSDRNRLDLRGLNTFAWRYRNRIALERDFKVGHVAFTPYARAEAYYSITEGSWDRAAFTGGVIFPFARHYEIEPYVERQVNSGSNPKYVNGFGLTFSVYL